MRGREGGRERDREEGKEGERLSQDRRKGAETCAVKRIGQEKIKEPQKIDTVEYISLNLLLISDQRLIQHG